MLLISRPVPDFIAAAVLADGTIQENFNLKQQISGKMAVIFFYPLDFTFVCPSELIAFDRRYAEFQSKDVIVIGISIDSQFTHAAWRQTPVNQGGIGPLQYPLVSDVKHEICRAFGVEHPQAGVALRGSFLVDQQGIVRHMVVNDLPLGRNIDEMLRMVDALQFHQTHGEVCPAQWHTGQPGMQANQQGVASYLSQHADKL